MFLARIIGRVVSTQKQDTLHAAAALIVHGR
jgi:microcompartment protein CcmK/EutM